MKKIIIYTDGACSGNPGVGGYGAILDYKGNIIKLSGAIENTTNNRMELMAVIKALQKLKEGCEVEVFSDSAYVINAFKQNWIENWQNNNWKTADKKLVKNIDLWQELLSQTKIHKISWNKVKGHSDNALNNECDLLATSAIKNFDENRE